MGSDTSLLGTDKAKATLTSVFDEAGHAWLDTDEAKVAPLYQQFIPFTKTAMDGFDRVSASWIHPFRPQIFFAPYSAYGRWVGVLFDYDH